MVAQIILLLVGLYMESVGCCGDGSSGNNQAMLQFSDGEFVRCPLPAMPSCSQCRELNLVPPPSQVGTGSKSGTSVSLQKAKKLINSKCRLKEYCSYIYFKGIVAPSAMLIVTKTLCF